MYINFPSIDINWNDFLEGLEDVAFKTGENNQFGEFTELIPNFSKIDFTFTSPLIIFS